MDQFRTDSRASEPVEFWKHRHNVILLTQNNSFNALCHVLDNKIIT